LGKSTKNWTSVAKTYLLYLLIILLFLDRLWYGPIGIKLEFAVLLILHGV